MLSLQLLLLLRLCQQRCLHSDALPLWVADPFKVECKVLVSRFGKTWFCRAACNYRHNRMCLLLTGTWGRRDLLVLGRVSEIHVFFCVFFSSSSLTFCQNNPRFSSTFGKIWVDLPKGVNTVITVL